METTSLKERYGLTEDALFEESNSNDNSLTDEELKIESLKIATNIGKLMSNVTTEDIVNIAATVAKFIKGGDDTELEAVDSTDSDEDETSNEETSEDFAIEDDDETEDSNNEETNESEEDFLI